MFDHEKLDVYRVSIQFVGWSYSLCKKLRGSDRHARDQLLRASQSIPLNIAEGNGKLPTPDRQRFLRIARGSALECSAILDVLNICGVAEDQVVNEGKQLLYRIVAMLSKMLIAIDQLREHGKVEYESREIDGSDFYN